MKTKPEWRALQMCKYCGGGESEENSDGLMVLCDCCMAVGTHIGCLKRETAKEIKPEDVILPSFQWFCGQECQHVNEYFVSITGQRMPLSGNGVFTAELVRYSDHYRNSQIVVGTAVSMFRSAFGPAKYSDGSDLVELVCQGKNHSINPHANNEEEQSDDDDDDDEEDQPPDCTNFRVFVLRKGGTIISAAALRPHGNLLAELPYIVTREGYRREGNCKRLLDAIEMILYKGGVKWMALPAVGATVDIWVNNFGFKKASTDICDALEQRIIVPDTTCILLKEVQDISLMKERLLHGGKAPMNSKYKGQKRVRWALPLGSINSMNDDTGNDDDDENTRKKKKKKRHGNKSDDDDDDDLYVGDSDSDPDSNDSDINNNNNNNMDDMTSHCGCSHCGNQSSTQWHEDEETGDFLCDSCIQGKKRNNNNNGKTLASNMVITKQSHDIDSITNTGITTPITTTINNNNNKSDEKKVCYNCGDSNAPRGYSQHKESGGWECITCKRYRHSHGNAVRPSKLFHRNNNNNKKNQEQSGTENVDNTGLTLATPYQQNTKRSAAVHATKKPRNPAKGLSRKHRSVQRRAALAIIAHKMCCAHRSTERTALLDTMNNFVNHVAMSDAVVIVASEIAAMNGKDLIKEKERMEGMEKEKQEEEMLLEKQREEEKERREKEERREMEEREQKRQLDEAHHHITAEIKAQHARDIENANQLNESLTQQLDRAKKEIEELTAILVQVKKEGDNNVINNNTKQRDDDILPVQKNNAALVIETINIASNSDKHHVDENKNEKEEKANSIKIDAHEKKNLGRGLFALFSQAMENDHSNSNSIINDNNTNITNITNTEKVPQLIDAICEENKCVFIVGKNNVHVNDLGGENCNNNDNSIEENMKSDENGDGAIYQEEEECLMCSRASSAANI